VNLKSYIAVFVFLYRRIKNIKVDCFRRLKHLKEKGRVFRDTHGTSPTLFRKVAKAYRRGFVGVHTVVASTAVAMGRERPMHGFSALLPEG
jgi:hypothetical protein